MSLVEKAAQRLRERADSNGPTPPPPRPEETVPPTDLSGAGTAVPPAHDNPVVVNIAALQRIGLVPPNVARDKIAREYQRVKRPILQVIAEDRDSPIGVNRLMVTSAKPGEGKSFTSLNLALSLAQELDHTVLLVDGDVASPRLSRALGLGKDPGLIDTLLSDDLSAEQVIRSTDIPRLSVMPAGRRYDQATELMASRRMRRLVDELAADSRRIVLFDSAPLLATAESQALAMTMGQIVFVVKAGHTERRALDSALSLLDQSAARVSLLLNQSRAAYGDEYDGYYGAYGGGVNGTSQL